MFEACAMRFQSALGCINMLQKATPLFPPSRPRERQLWPRSICCNQNDTGKRLTCPIAAEHLAGGAAGDDSVHGRTPSVTGRDHIPRRPDRLPERPGAHHQRKRPASAVHRLIETPKPQQSKSINDVESQSKLHRPNRIESPLTKHLLNRSTRSPTRRLTELRPMDESMGAGVRLAGYRGGLPW